MEDALYTSVEVREVVNDRCLDSKGRVETITWSSESTLGSLRELVEWDREAHRGLRMGKEIEGPAKGLRRSTCGGSQGAGRGSISQPREWSSLYRESMSLG